MQRQNSLQSLQRLCKDDQSNQLAKCIGMGDFASKSDADAHMRDRWHCTRRTYDFLPIYETVIKQAL